MKMSHAEMEAIIIRASEVQKSVLIRGAPGTGKSYTVRKIAKKIAASMGRKFVEWNKLSREAKLSIYRNTDKICDTVYVFADVRLAQWDPADFRLPALSQDNELCEWKAPLLFACFSKPECAGMLFLDEYANASPAVQAGAQQVILDRAVGEIPISDKVALVAACNRSEDRAGVFDISAPQANRFYHIDLVEASCDDWLNNFAYPAGVDVRIVTFLKWDPSKLMASQKEITELNSLAFPTHRTWTMASELMAGMDDNFAIKAVTGYCGEAVGSVFRGYMEVVSKVDLDMALTKPTEYVKKYHNDTQLLYGTLSAMIGRFNQDQKSLDKVMSFALALTDNQLKDWAASLIILLRNSKHFVGADAQKFLKAMSAHKELFPRIRDELFKFISAFPTSW